MKKTTLMASALMAAATVITAQAATRSSVFDDVKVWYKGSAGNAVGSADSSAVSKVKSLPHLADTSSPSHGGTYQWWGWRLQYTNQKVDCPYAGVTLDSTPCIVVPPAVRNDDTSTTTPSGYAEVTIDGVPSTQPYWNVRRYGALYFDNWMSDWATDTVCSNYTCVLRFRSDMVNHAHNNDNSIVKIGNSWTSTAGAAAGVCLTLNPTGSLTDQVWPRITVGTYNPDYTDYPIKDGRWIDCALVVNGQILDTWLCWNDGTDETPTNRLVKITKKYPTTAALPTIKGGCRVFLASYDQWTYGASYTNGIYNSEMVGKAFEGAFHQIAFWDRTLSEEEVREAMAGGTGRPNLVQVGMEGNGVAEFATSSQSASVANTGAWEYLNPALSAQNPTATISFTCPSLWAGQPQWLRVCGASGVGRVAATINNAAIGECAVAADGAGRIFVPANIIVSGANTLVLTRTDGSPVIDAVTLGGSWRFGNNVNSFGYQSSNETNPDRYVFHPACGSDEIHNRSTFSNGGSRETHFSIFIPEDLAGRYRGIFTTRTQNTGWPTAAEMPYSFHANDTKIGDFVLKGGTETEVTIPETALVAGWNTFYWKTTSSGYWANIDWHKFTLRDAPGTFVITVR